MEPRTTHLLSALFAGGVIGVGTGTVIPEPALAILTAIFWATGIGLTLRTYRQVPDWPVDPEDEQRWWKATTQRGWLGLVAALTVGMAVFYWAFVQFVITVDPATELWLIVTMTAIGPLVTGVVGVMNELLPDDGDGDDTADSTAV